MSPRRFSKTPKKPRESPRPRKQDVECPKCGLTFSADDDRDTPVTGCVAEHRGIVADLSRCCLRNSLSSMLGDDVP